MRAKMGTNTKSLGIGYDSCSQLVAFNTSIWVFIFLEGNWRVLEAEMEDQIWLTEFVCTWSILNVWPGWQKVESWRWLFFFFFFTPAVLEEFLGLRICLTTVFYWKLKIKNIKYYNKIIFECVNSIVRLSFKFSFI